MSDDGAEGGAEVITFLEYAGEAKKRDRGGDGDGGGPPRPPIGPPGGDGSTPQPTFGSEDMLSEELSKELGEDWICAQPGGEWYWWDSRRWDKRRGDFLIRQKVQLIARRIAAPVGLQMLARQICRRNTTAAAVGYVTTNERHGKFAGDMNQEGPFEINTPEGIVNLRNGVVTPHDRERLLTRLSGAGPEPMAPCPRWRQYLDEATGGDKQLQDYLQRMSGYFLTGMIDEHKIFFLFGKSRTGKTVYLSIMAALLGDYAITASVDMFLQQDGHRHLTEVMDLDGPRLVMAGETPAGRRWNDALLKQLSGGDRLRANRMRQDTVEFIPHCKVALAGNHRPRLRSGDDGMRERFIVIPFAHRQPVLDKGLTDKLKEELPGIFVWALEGEIKRQAGAGLDLANAPLVVREATDEYFQTEDMLRSWLDECCELGADYTTLTDTLYQNFRKWSERTGERWPPPAHKFHEELAKLDELGIKKGWRDPRTKRRGFAGLRLAQDQLELRP